MRTKTFLSILLSALLLCAPLSAAERILNDRTEEHTRLPQPPQTLQDGETRDWSRSVAAPVPWLTVEDHVLTVYDESGRKVFCGVYPSLRCANDSTSPLAKALVEWNAEQSMNIWHSPVRRFSEEDRGNGEEIVTHYSDVVPITQWGRVDDRVISFLMKGSSYTGGLHPFPHVEAYTFDRVSGRQLALDEIITGRESLIEAIAAAFPTQYPNLALEDFPRGIREVLRIQHPADRGLTSFCWYIAADGNLTIYYPVSTLTTYAAGDFSLTIAREDAPHLFTAAYPMD